LRKTPFFVQNPSETTLSPYLFNGGGYAEKTRIRQRGGDHGASRTNDRKRIFERNAGRKTMPLVLRYAKDKFGFTPSNFLYHAHIRIHLLIMPGKKEPNFR
jgi:hypothetical protein